MSALHPGIRHRREWLSSSVFWLDDWLRKRQQVYEYSDDQACLFRIQRARAEAEVRLADGVCVRRGDPLLNLHVWNEHLRALGPSRTDLRWSRLLGREIAASLTRLAAHMARDPSYDEIVALRADMRFGDAEQNVRIVRLSTRYGFESVRKPESEKNGAIRELGEKTLELMLILAANPCAARLSVLKNESTLIYMSRATFDRYDPRRSRTDDARR